MSDVLSVVKAMDILDAVAAAGGAGIGTRQLARQLGLNVTSVHNIATTLKNKGYLQQASRGKAFYLGMHILSLASGGDWARSLAEIARPEILKLSEELKEAVLLAGMFNGKMLKLEFITSKHHPLRVQEPDDFEPFAHTMACGKVLLSGMTAGELKDYIARNKFEKFTDTTHVNPAIIAGELNDVKKQGYAETHDELCDGISAIAVPVHNITGKIIAALGTSLPSVRFKPSWRKDALKTLRKAADNIETLINKQE